MRVPLLLAAVLGGCSGTAAAQARPTILDTDLGDYDDVVTIMLAAVHPAINLRGVVVTGSQPEAGARTVAKTLDLMGRTDVPIYIGDSAIGPRPSFNYWSQFPRRRWDLQPTLGQWARDYPARIAARTGRSFYVDEILQHPGEVAVVVIGPLSSFAAALRAADSSGQGQAFRRAIGQLNISGGDFGTVEYNVYADVGAARLVYASGATIYQFGGEGGGKALLTHSRREQLWRGATPATWALQDYYRLYRAGWDPTAPFTPILYDAFALAQLFPGEPVCEFENFAVRVDSIGHLVRVDGRATTHSRTLNHPERLLDLIERQLIDPAAAAANHLRRVQELAVSSVPDFSSVAGTLAQRVDERRASELDHVAAQVDSMARALPAFAGRTEVLGHLHMAKGFLRGQPRAHPWHDPYTPVYVTAYLGYLTLPKRRIAVGGALLLLAGAWFAYRRRTRAATPHTSSGS